VASLNYYHLAYLPSLGEPGDPVEITGSELLLQLLDGGEKTAAGEITEAILISDDLLQRDSFIAGQIDEPRPSVLTVAQVQDEDPLPESLFAETAAQESRKVDSTWDLYFRYAHSTAERLNSRFLSAWIGYEVALRNAIAEKRAQDLGLDPGDYLVATDLASGDVSRDVADWIAATAQTPLAGQKSLDTARWRWLNETEPYYSFGDDEICAYAARFVVADRWARLNEAINKHNQEHNRTGQ